MHQTEHKYRGSPTSTVSTSTISTSTNFRAIGIKSVLVEFLPDCYVEKLVPVEIGYVVPTKGCLSLFNCFININEPFFCQKNMIVKHSILILCCEGIKHVFFDKKLTN